MTGQDNRRFHPRNPLRRWVIFPALLLLISSGAAALPQDTGVTIYSKETTGNTDVPRLEVTTTVVGSHPAVLRIRRIADATIGTTVDSNILELQGASFSTQSDSQGFQLQTRMNSTDPRLAFSWNNGSTTTEIFFIDKSGSLDIGAGKFAVTASTGNTAIAGTLGVTGNFTVNTNKFMVDNITGDITIAGTTTFNSLTYTWPGTAAAGQVLQSDVNGILSWVTPLSGTVTNVVTGTGLSGGPITDSGTISLAPMADATIKGNVSGNTATPSDL